jgi:hypothetical protein
LREYRWKLNPNKCVFGVPSGKLLGFIISHRGIKANPEKIFAITSMKPPMFIKDVQKLTGCMAALNRFISKLGDRGHPSSNYSSIKRSSRGLQRQTKPLLSSRTSYPSHQSSRLLAKRSSYCSTSLRLPTWSVLPLSSRGRKTATPTQSSDQSISSARSCRNLRHAINQYRSYCMQCSSPRGSYDTTEYSISVVTDYPLGDILRNQDATGRISKWAVELGALNIDFKPRTTIKSQALVDFMAEWRENQLPTPTERPEHKVMYFDDSLKLEGAGAGVLLISPTGEQLMYVL